MIEPTVFFEYLELEPFHLFLKKPERRRLLPFFSYWNTYARSDDERKFAYVLANFHLQKDALPAPLSNAEVASRFAIADKEWSNVRTLEALEGPTDPERLADVFYTAMSAIRPISLAQVLTEELKSIDGGNFADDDLDRVFEEFHRRNLTALCFSGGGIRSATFGLGIVQALAKNGLLRKFDYLSTVSGGGYLGSWLSAWVLREQIEAASTKERKAALADEEAAGFDVIEGGTLQHDLREKVSRRASPVGVQGVEKQINGCPIDGSGPNPEPKELQHLREYSNYMSPRRGLLSADTWTLIAIYLRNLFLNQTIFIPLIAAVLLLPRFFFLVIENRDPEPVVAWITLIVAALLGGMSMAFVISQLPSRLAAKRDKETGGEARTGVAAAVQGDPGKDGTKTPESGGAIQPEANTEDNTDVGVLKRGVFPLFFCGICASSLWAWNYRSNYKLYETLDIAGLGIRTHPDRAIIYFLIVAALAFVVGGVFLYALTRPKSFDWVGTFSAFIAALVGAILLWLICVKLVGTEPLGWNLNPYEWPLYLAFSVPLFLLVVLIAATVFVGLSSGKATDEDREWLARYGAWVLIVSVVWAATNIVVLLGPSALEAVFRSVTWERLDLRTGLAPAIVSAIGVLSGIVSLLGGFSEKSQVRNEPVKTRTSQILAFAPKIAAVVFLGFILVTISYLTSALIYAVASLFSLTSWTEMPSHALILARTHIVVLAGVLLLLGTIGLVMACFVNVNKFSLHGAYRDRLVRAYLGASNTRRRRNSFTGFDDRDNFQLHRLKDQKPFHVINATVNLVGGKTLAWQNRKAASFTMSPLHCGSWTLGYRNTNEYCRNAKLGPCKDLDVCNKVGEKCRLGPDNVTPVCEIPGKAIRLGTAMAISGAAANPNMGYYSSSVVTFLMSLFNIRLGWWLGNTNAIGARLDYQQRPFYGKSSPSVAVLPLLNEMLGRTDESKRFINVTDGGHFENLALYEMVLRRCRLIVLSDGAADAEFKFGEIANAIQKCKVDLGVDIQLLGTMNIKGRKTDEEGRGHDHDKPVNSRFAIAKITYPETHFEKVTDKRTGEETEIERHNAGWLLYTRPAYYKNEPRDIVYYADSNENFPHQSTGDQMYDEKQFEAYRGLGYLTMSEIRNIFDATSKGDPNDMVDDGLENLFAEDEDMRKAIFRFFNLPAADSFKTRAARRRKTE